MTAAPTQKAIHTAQQHVQQLERDAERLDAMIQGTLQTVREARAGTDEDLRSAAQQLSGLREAHQDVLQELDSARDTLDRLRADQERHALAQQLQQHTNAAHALQERILSAYQTALEGIADHLRDAADARAERARIVESARRAADALNAPAPNIPQHVNVPALLDDSRHTPATGRMLTALLEAETAPLLLTPEQIAHQAERSARAKLARAQSIWDTRSAIVRAAQDKQHATPEVEAHAAWLRRNPRPETLDDLEDAA